MNITDSLSDAAILDELGERISRARIESGKTQAALAADAGVSKRTLERMEAGASSQTANLIRVLRALGLLKRLDLLLPPPQPRPMDLLRNQGRQRRRASPRSRQKETPGPWRWGDES